MNAPGFDALLQDALELPLEERSRMASRLIESIDQDDSTLVSPAWAAELSRRIESIRNGTAELIPHDEVMAEARQRLVQVRQSKAG
jgi:putative addiction module component (TIGR02574 family)